jgi:hypothetical protein
MQRKERNKENKEIKERDREKKKTRVLFKGAFQVLQMNQSNKQDAHKNFKFIHFKHSCKQ